MLRRMIGRSGGRGLALLLAVLALAPGAFAEEASAPEASWWPALSFQAGMLVHSFYNRASSSDLADAPLMNPDPIRPPAAGTSAYLAPWLLADLELMGPRLLDPALLADTAVRPFAHGGLGVNFGISRDIGKERTTGPFEVPPIPNAVRDTPSVEDAVLGQGTTMTVQNEPVFFTVGTGLAFAFDAMDRRIRVKPSFEYLWEQVTGRGVVHRAVLENPRPPTGTPPRVTIDDFRLINLNREETRDFHGIGPGLEIEMDVSRKDTDTVVSVFAAGSAYHWVGGRDFGFRKTNDLGESADFRVNRDPWSWRLGVGVRIRFEQ